MKRNITIANRLREVFLNGHWIANTNYTEQLQSINWQQATKQVGSLNTIALLTYHINYYIAGLLHSFNTGILEISDKYSFDCPKLNSEADWAKLVSIFFINATSFIDSIDKMDDTVFDEPFIDERYGTYLRNIEGVIEHCYYHLGQIVLINKLTSL